jgi:hypothetical protein
VGPSFAEKLAMTVSPIAISDSPISSSEKDGPIFSPGKAFKLSAAERERLVGRAPTNGILRMTLWLRDARNLRWARFF